MFGAILKAINCSFRKGITLCRSIYVTKVMKLLAFIFEQPSYIFYYCFSDLCYETDRILKYLLLKHILYFCCYSKHKMGFKLVVVVVVDLYLDIQNRAILVIRENRTCVHLYL